MKLLLTTLILAASLQAQTTVSPNRKLTQREFETLAVRCAPGVALETVEPIARTESAFNVASINLNRPISAARRAGWNHHRLELMRQPHTREEAIQWMHWFSEKGYSVSVGLMQVNTDNARRFGVTPEQLFDPCLNLKIGSAILTTAYLQSLQRPHTDDSALLDAISLYNSGSARIGYTNGYVGSVLNNRQGYHAVPTPTVRGSK